MTDHTGRPRAPLSPRLELEAAEIAALLEVEVVQGKVAKAATAGFSISATAGAGPPLAVVGSAGQLAVGEPVTPRALFDLASITKPIVACAAARLAQRGVLDFAAPMQELVEETRDTPSGALRFELFLAHRAGLAAHRPLFVPLFHGAPLRRAAALREAALARRKECTGAAPSEGFAPLYSDLSYLLVGAALERVTGSPLDSVIEDELARPLRLELGSAQKLLRTRPDFAAQVAPTENVPARGGPVRGIVHDENAWALSGHATSGHAGLFGSAGAVLGFGHAVLAALRGESTWLKVSAVLPLLRERPGGTLRAGFDGKSDSSSTAGTVAGPRTFGHLGFTGTSMWCDPEAEAVSVLLTNRVNPTRANLRIRGARPNVHDALFRRAAALRDLLLRAAPVP
jgi:CubicO group peptidase (beta-lactamase class C family)